MKGALPLVLGVLGGVLGGLIVRMVEPEPAPVRVASPVVERPPAVESAARVDTELLLHRIEQIESRVAEIVPEDGARATRTASTAAAEGEGPGEGTSEVAPDQAIADLIRGLKGKRLTPKDTNRLFGWLTIRKEQIKDVITALQKEIAADPTNAELQVALATAYVADLTNNTLPGPQQGLVWMKASSAYEAAIKLEPEHWMARYGKAFGTSQAPEFLGMRPEAIRQFEELLEIQRRKAPEPHFASTYFQLGTLYKDAGNVEKARELWNEGLRLFPDNEELKGTIEVSTKK